MTDFNLTFPKRKSRIGFHFFPDTLHYRESDMQTWLPELLSLGASWIILQAPVDRAIPESFITGLVKNGIEPVLNFDLSPAAPQKAEDLQTLFESYARWGVHYVILFQRPNSRASWPVAGWAQQDLIDRFLDRYLPVAQAALSCGLAPVFPPLEPGGNYWDTVFLKASLEALERRKQTNLLNNLVLSAYAWTGSRPLNWGTGGPDKWRTTRPYFTPPQAEDQRGFRIYEWYAAIARSATGKDVPIILLSAGVKGNPESSEAFAPDEHLTTNIAIAQLMAGEAISDPAAPEVRLAPVPEQVICCNFWLLTASPVHPAYRQSWMAEGSPYISTFQALKEWYADFNRNKTAVPQVIVDPDHPIDHYLLLPTYDWGISDWHLEVARPFIKKYRPTIGFSVKDARLAKAVTVVGNIHSFTEEALDQLRAAGCRVERISGDGISIATQLAER